MREQEIFTMSDKERVAFCGQCLMSRLEVVRIVNGVGCPKCGKPDSGQRREPTKVIKTKKRIKP